MRVRFIDAVVHSVRLRGTEPGSGARLQAPPTPRWQLLPVVQILNFVQEEVAAKRGDES